MDKLRTPQPAPLALLSGCLVKLIVDGLELLPTQQNNEHRKTLHVENVA